MITIIHQTLFLPTPFHPSLENISSLNEPNSTQNKRDLQWFPRNRAAKVLELAQPFINCTVLDAISNTVAPQPSCVALEVKLKISLKSVIKTQENRTNKLKSSHFIDSPTARQIRALLFAIFEYLLPYPRKASHDTLTPPQSVSVLFRASSPHAPTLVGANQILRNKCSLKPICCIPVVYQFSL